MDSGRISASTSDLGIQPVVNTSITQKHVSSKVNPATLSTHILLIDKDFIVRPPKNLTHRLTGEQRFRIATFLVKMFDGRYSNHQLLRLVPREAERWSGLRMKGGGDIIRCRVDPEQRTSTSTRDSSFVCVGRLAPQKHSQLEC